MTPTQIHAIATEALMDRIIFSIDGATQESYGKYRVGGSFNKAFGKMKRLVETSRAAGTWQKDVNDQAGHLQVIWQYILFEWNDTDEEIKLARQLAQNIDVPIQWVITSGYGASKRFLPGSAEVVKLHDPPDSFIHLAALTEIETRLAKNDVGTINVSCELLKLPYGLWRKGYRASFRSDRNLIVAPAGSMMTLDVNVANRTNQRWNVGDPNYLRLGVQLKNPSQAAITELTGAKLTSATTVPGGSETITIPIRLPGEPGEYKLVLDMVHEFVCWFGSRGSSPEVFDLRIE